MSAGPRFEGTTSASDENRQPDVPLTPQEPQAEPPTASKSDSQKYSEGE